MSTLDPFGRPTGRGLRRASRSAVRPLVVAFVIFDLMVLAVVGALFATGVFGGSGDDTVIIPPAGEVSTVDDDDDDERDDDGMTTVTRETGTTRIIDEDVSGDDDRPGDADDAPAGPAPAGLNATSMIRESNLRPALAELRRLAPGRVLNLSLHPSHVTVQVKSPGGDLVILTARPERAQILNTVQGAAGHRDDAVAWSQIDPAAPERLTKALGAGAESGPRSVNHLVVMPGLAPWALHRRSGERIPATASGRPQR